MWQLPRVQARSKRQSRSLRLRNALTHVECGHSASYATARSEFTELHNQDSDLPLSERFGTSLLIALRPWAPGVFKKLQRKGVAKVF